MINRSDIEAFEYYNDMVEDLSYKDTFETMDGYQTFTQSTAIYPANKGLEYVALGLASEAGEFAGKIKKFIRDGVLDKEAAVAELGDILWYLARAAEELDTLLSTAARINVDKLTDRFNRGVIKGNGDYR